MNIQLSISCGLLFGLTSLAVGGRNARQQVIRNDVDQELIRNAIGIRQFQGNRLQLNQNLGIAHNAGSRAANTVHQPFTGAVTAEKIRIAIDDAVMFLRSCQASDGSIEESMTHYAHGAGTVMATLAMLAAGADPASDDSVQRALRWLSENDVQNTYYRAVRANVWEYALRKSPYEELYREKLEEDFDWLLKALNKKEGWRYLMTSRDWDNSVTQYGVLGIWAAARG